MIWFWWNTHVTVVHCIPRIQSLPKFKLTCTFKWRMPCGLKLFILHLFFLQNKAVGMTWSPWGMYWCTLIEVPCLGKDWRQLPRDRNMNESVKRKCRRLLKNYAKVTQVSHTMTGGWVFILWALVLSDEIGNSDILFIQRFFKCHLISKYRWSLTFRYMTFIQPTPKPSFVCWIWALVHSWWKKFWVFAQWRCKTESHTLFWVY